MVNVSRPGALLDYALKLERVGGNGMLVSGGCDTSGRVMFKPHHFREMALIKERTDLSLNLHTGLIDDRTVERIAKIGVDSVSLDVVGEDSTVSETLHGKWGVDEYENTFLSLVDSGIKVVPHVLVGLNRGAPSGEKKAVDMISRFDPGQAVMIILIPTPGTPMEGIRPPSKSYVLDIARYMTEKLSSRLVLGCMRPRSYRGLEVDLMEMGFAGVVVPGRSAVQHAREMGWEILEHRRCCAVFDL